MSDVSTAAQVGLSAIQTVIDRARMLKDPKYDSLVAFTRVARVEPLLLVDTDVLFVDELHDVEQSLLTMFAGYYLQGVALNSTIGNVRIMSTLDKFNPNRDVGAAAGVKSLARESYRDRLPTVWEDGLALEADANRDPHARLGKQVDPDEVDERLRRMKRESEMSRIEREKAEHARVVTSLGDRAVSDLKENVNLSIGKMIEVTIRHEDKTVTVPIAIRLIANTIPAAKLVHILSLGDEETSATERYHGWRSGRLAFWKDLVFCRDLIDAHRKNLMVHGDELYRNILMKEQRNRFAAILSGSPSIAAASNMVITSGSTIAELELVMTGRFSDFHARQKLFEKTSLMIVAVIDKEWSRVQFYTRGIPETTDVSFRDLKASAKGHGPDVSDILRAYQLGAAPTL